MLLIICRERQLFIVKEKKKLLWTEAKSQESEKTNSDSSRNPVRYQEQSISRPVHISYILNLFI
jgi:hypothetical protein